MYLDTVPGRAHQSEPAHERTGWTVDVGDPCADRFLDRAAELTREQDKGRINIDQLQEILRRESPLM